MKEATEFTRTAIRRLVKERGIRDVGLAELLRVPKSTVSRLLSGDRQMDLATLLAIARALNVAPAQLVPSANEPPVDELGLMRDEAVAAVSRLMEAIDRTRDRRRRPISLPGYRRVKEIRVRDYDAVVAYIRRSGLAIGDVPAGTPREPTAIVADEWSGEWWTREHPQEERGQEFSE